MTQERAIEDTVELLQTFGLQEYEARCFVALTQLSPATANEISNVSEVPRTRVYDATNVLAEKGLVEVQDGTPKHFRAVGIDEAIQTLDQQRQTRLETLETQLSELDTPEDALEDVQRQEVWSLTGHEAIQTRTEDVVAEADSEIVLLVVEEALLTERLVENLRQAHERGVTVIVGGVGCHQ